MYVAQTQDTLELAKHRDDRKCESKTNDCSTKNAHCHGASAACPFCTFLVQLFDMFLVFLFFPFFVVGHVKETLAEENQDKW